MLHPIGPPKWQKVALAITLDYYIQPCLLPDTVCWLKACLTVRHWTADIWHTAFDIVPMIQNTARISGELTSDCMNSTKFTGKPITYKGQSSKFEPVFSCHSDQTFLSYMKALMQTQYEHKSDRGLPHCTAVLPPWPWMAIRWNVDMLVTQALIITIIILKIQRHWWKVIMWVHRGQTGAG